VIIADVLDYGKKYYCPSAVAHNLNLKAVYLPPPHLNINGRIHNECGISCAHLLAWKIDQALKDLDNEEAS